jgi:flagellar biosynthesis GTPase FlhF
MSKLKFNGDYLTNQVLTMSKYFDGFKAKNDIENMFVILKEIRIIHGMMIVKQNQMIKKSSAPDDFYNLSIFDNAVKSTNKLIQDYEEKVYQMMKETKENLGEQQKENLVEQKKEDLVEQQKEDLVEQQKEDLVEQQKEDLAEQLEEEQKEQQKEDIAKKQKEDLAEQLEEQQKIENKEKFNSDNASILYFSDSTCEYSIRFDSVWDEFKIRSKDYKLNKIKIDCNKNLDKCHDFNISEYPTIRLFIDDNMIPFKKPRTIDNLMDFIKDIPLNKKIDN